MNMATKTTMLTVIMLGLPATASSQGTNSLNSSAMNGADDPVSFRSNALAGIINDDLDLIYDPIELQFVEGIRLYTNLSNLTSGQERLFDDYSDDEFLLGASSENPRWDELRHSLLYCFRNATESNGVSIDSDLDGYADVYGFGMLSDEYTAYFDTDYDGLYDRKRSVSQEASDVTSDDRYSFALNNTLVLDGLALGAKLALGSGTLRGNTATASLGSGSRLLGRIDPGDSSMRRSEISHQIDGGYDDLVWSETGEFLSEARLNHSRLDFAAMRPMRGLEVRLDAGILGGEVTSTVDDRYSGGYEYFQPDMVDYLHRYSESDSYSSVVEEGAGRLRLGTSVRKTFDEQAERRNKGFWAVGISLGFGSNDYKESEVSRFESSELVSETRRDREVTRDGAAVDSGTQTAREYGLAARLNMPLGDRVHFGIGGRLNRSSLDRETAYSESLKVVTDHDPMDWVGSDYVRTETSAMSANRNVDISTTTWTCPVGLEYLVDEGNNWALRFGTVFRHITETRNDAIQVTDSEPYVSETVWGDGEVEIDIDDNVYESTSEHVTTITSATVFTYGLGYTPTENLQVDLLGLFDGYPDSVFDAAFYRSLRLSFTMKF